MLRSNAKNLEVTLPSATQRGGDIGGLESPVLDEIDFFGGGKMSGNGPASPFIKDDPDWDLGSMPNQNHFNMHMQHQSYPQVAPGSIDPNDLQAHHQSDNFNGGGGGGFNFNAPPSSNAMTGSFHMGNSGIGDDELAALDLRPNPVNDPLSEFTFDQPTHPASAGPNAFSSTPNGEPLQSPFLQSNFSFYQQQQQQPQHQHPHPVSGAMVSPRMRPQSQSGAMEGGFHFTSGPRRSLPHTMDRKTSDSRSPMTPKTPGLAGLTIGGTPESSSLGSQPMSALSHRHQKSLSGQWDHSPVSYIDSPLASPTNANHAAISEVLKSGKGMSLPTAKIEHHAGPAYQSQEAKRRRRRESHNLVERRRRDNINERIQELSHLVPSHRLEDEKVRKFLANNGPLSPSILPTTGVSPPQATSMLAAAGGRRATGPGSLTIGLPAVDDKDKGPNKGDILNGSVSWTRDLMWALHKKLEQEAQLKQLLESLGQTFPFTDNEDDARMRSELQDTMDKNDPSTFAYSRGDGTGLRVPKYTDHAGQTLPAHQQGRASPTSVSPGGLGEGSASGASTGQPYWAGNSGADALKEEDEFDMNMS